MDRDERVRAKIAKVPGRFRRMINQVKLLYGMIKDFKGGIYREIPWYTISMSVAAVLYFLNPLDFIPDWLAFAGFVDDAAVIALMFKAMRDDLSRYCQFKGYDPGEYF